MSRIYKEHAQNRYAIIERVSLTLYSLNHAFKSASSLNYCTILNLRVMKAIKKFNKTEMKKAIYQAVTNMKDMDAYIMCVGVFNLLKIMDKYYQDKHGSPKRMRDLEEYVDTIKVAYLKKGSK